jgi:hypothetical protein
LAHPSFLRVKRENIFQFFNKLFGGFFRVFVAFPLIHQQTQTTLRALEVAEQVGDQLDNLSTTNIRYEKKGYLTGITKIIHNLHFFSRCKPLNVV